MGCYPGAADSASAQGARSGQPGAKSFPASLTSPSQQPGLEAQLLSSRRGNDGVMEPKAGFESRALDLEVASSYLISQETPACASPPPPPRPRAWLRSRPLGLQFRTRKALGSGGWAGGLGGLEKARVPRGGQTGSESVLCPLTMHSAPASLGLPLTLGATCV